ncbi:MAG TPA: FAD-linked oxidase C-terminal domain-containing protein [Chthoniobacterales bacterium]|nr:FAD-linked oxidase C-terminal domain-containing protein [Chthoniobacterales bacterium]
MTSAAAQQRIRASGCDVRFDNLTRQLYATDASIYQIEPLGVAFPTSAQDASAVIKAAAEDNISVTPRGAGTSLVGNAVGEGLIVDFSRHNREIDNLNIDNRSVRVGAGVVLDQLNAFLNPHGFCFGPDVATSSRATIGGMIANNSSGAHVPVYGTTADHVLSTEIVLADGRVVTVGSQHEALREEQSKIDNLVRAHAAEMSDRWPPGLLKRWPGYGIERFSRAPNNLNEILAGSEGTLAAIFSAELKISPLPSEKGLGLIFFASVTDAMQATVALIDLKPAAIEHIDRPLLDQTKGQLHFQAARELLELDTNPCAAILVVEFYDNVSEKLSILQSRNLGLRTKICRDANEMNLVWMVRKAGLSLLTGCIGPAKPVAFIEDAAVRPAQLPDYVRGLQSIMKSLGLEASYYGHAASGLLHVRPVLDLHSADDLRKFRLVADQTSALVRQFKGSLSAEHGVGVARAEYMRDQLGDALLNVMREIKRTFDPKNIFNPGKIFGFAYKIDNHLRNNFTKPIELPFETRLAFAFKDRSFIGNLEQCNGCGGCRKDAPIMCPTFIATGDEVMSTRGRANIIRRSLELREHGHDPLKSAELDAALSNCLSCKGCTPECPSNVNLALLKAEMLYARYKRDGLPLRERFFSSVDLLGRIGCTVPELANATLDLAPVRSLMEKALGISAKRSLPHYTRKRFDRWFGKHTTEGPASAGPGRAEARPSESRGKVILWDDTFVRYHEPNIGIAAVKVLEALGFEVELLQSRKCCGRPAFSQGNLDAAAKAAQHNVDLLTSSQPLNEASPARTSTSQQSAPPIIFLEPSCWSMFVEDYRELRIDNADKIAARCFLFEKFVDDLLEREPDALRFKDRQVNVAIHAHCHARSLTNPAFMARLVERLPGHKATLLDTGCCGMAGAFGALAEKYELSKQVAADLLRKIDNQQADVVIASGTSCRHQIVDLSSVWPKHMAELLADAIV